MENIFKSAYSRQNWIELIHDIFGNTYKVFQNPQDETVDNEIAVKALRLGEIELTDGHIIAVYDTQLQPNIQLHRNKVAIRNLLRQSWKLYDGAFVANYKSDSDEWRFSFISETKGFDPDGNYKKIITQPKRYTYLFGESHPCRTALQRFEVLRNSAKTLDDIKEAFSVEALSKDFYTKLFDWYSWATSDNSGVTFPNNTDIYVDDRDNINIKIIRMITRLLFVWFIKQKGLIPDNIFDEKQLCVILKDFDPESSNNGNYYNAILQNLFFGTLNRAIVDDDGDPRRFANLKDKRDLRNLYRYAEMFTISEDEVIDLFSKIPFLNGGLFECLDKFKKTGIMQETDIYLDGFSRNAMRSANGNYRYRAFVPNILFFSDDDSQPGLIHLFKQYNFTIEENSPNDAQVSLDPELLGRVFENLLAAYNPETQESARKSTGSFYTPREIVDYMVDESLIAHLQQHCPDLKEPEIRILFTAHTRPEEWTETQCEQAVTEIKSIKILDPACGSGAFPMGCLLRIVEIVELLQPQKEERYTLKLHLIENSIYGVDIQPIAMLISKLRFFISLICEQHDIDFSKPEENFGINTLPNLETKFVAANTLISVKKKEVQGNLFEDPEIDKTKNELIDIRNRHFYAKSTYAKNRLRDKDAELREKLSGLLSVNNEYAPEDAKQFAQWNPYDQNASSPFFDPEWMFGIGTNSVKSSPEIDVFNLRIRAINTQIDVINKSISTGFNELIVKLQIITALQQATDIKIEITKIKQQIDKLYGEIYNHIKGIVKEPTDYSYYINSLNLQIRKLNRQIDDIARQLQPVKQGGGGFDIVIGNPPYIQLQNNGGALAKQLEGQHYQTFARKGDIYCCFYERGIQLLKPEAYLCYITSNKWMRAGYGEATRKFFADNTNPIQLIDFAGVKIFESATVDTNILLLQKTKNASQTLACVTKGADCKNNLSDYVRQNASVCSFSSSDSWVILSPIEQSIKHKIEKVGTPLRDWDINIYRGVLTGCNEAFIISGEKRNEILENCQTEDERVKTEELIRPILRGRDIKRYGYEFADLWLINTHNGVKGKGIKRIDINDYPAVKAHLDNYWNLIEKRADQGDTPYNLRNCAYMEDFFKQKIMYSELTQGSCFIFDETCKLFTLQTGYIIVGNNLKYLLAMLNSKFIEWAFRRFYSIELGGSGLRWLKQYVETIPIPKPTIEIGKQIKKLLQNQEYHEIDKLVYSIYDLSKEEIAFITNRED